jgi:hypothetical protein
LDVPGGGWLTNDGNDDEWIVAYHGTSLQATQRIILEGLLSGWWQPFRNNLNMNPLSAVGHIEFGIFCTPNVQ